MKIFVKQIVRHPIIVACLIFLLVSSIVVSSIGYVSWIGANQQLSLINNNYTTIAILSGANYEKLLFGDRATFVGLDSLKFSDGTFYIGPQSAKTTAQQSPYYISSESNVLLSAYVAGSTAITSGSIDILKYNSELDNHCYSLSVLSVKCVDILPTLPSDYLDTVSYIAVFEILDDVCLMDAYDIPPYNDKIYATTELYDRNGNIPFAVGNTYLIRGKYGDYPIGPTYVLVEDEIGQHWEQGYKRLDDDDELGRSFILEGDGELIFSSISEMGVTSGVQNFITEKMQYPDSDLCYWTTPEDCWPYYAEYEGDWKDYLETEDGRVWKEEIIPNFEMNHASATVILTDNLETMYNFNTGDASILKGRTFYEAEYQNGENVCLISASYAKANDYNIGDTISLDYYDTGFSQINYDLGGFYGRQGITVQRLPLTAENHMDIQEDYTIVGIYTAPEWSAGLHSFHADTIFVPKASVPGMESYVGESIPMLSAITIQNGSIDAFEAHMAANDKAGAYLYFDQGYTEVAASVQTLIDNAKRIMIIGVSMFILASLLFLLLHTRRTAPVIRAMRLLGVASKKTWLECFTALICQVVMAVLIGNTLAILLYDRITQMILSASLELSYSSVALCGAVQFLVLFVIGIIWTRSVANRNLIQKR